MKFHKKALIIGVDSTIGRNLLNQLRVAGWQVFGTTRKKERVDNCFTLYLDLYHAEDFVFEESIDAVFLCAAVIGQAYCRNNPEYTRVINVDAPILLAKHLQGKAKSIVFLSSTAVFDGAYPFRSEGDATCPLTLYGQQKVEVEEALLKWDPDVAIVRLSKVLAPDLLLIRTWIDALSRGEVIQPFYDLCVTPISVAFVVHCLQMIAEKRMSGIIHLSGNEEVTYADIARRLAKNMNASETLIEPQSALSAGIAPEQMPLHSSLKVRGAAFFDLEAYPGLEETLDDLCK